MSPVSAVFEPYSEAEQVWQWLESRYGIPQAVFAQHKLWQRVGAPALWIVGADCCPPPGAKVEAIGMMALRDPPPGGKPTSSFLLEFGHHATRNVYQLSDAEALMFLEDGPLDVVPVDDGRGYCIVRTEELVIGCGRLAREPNADGTRRLLCEVPRSWRASLAGWPSLNRDVSDGES
ncbi:MAG: hypothetical protein ACE366_09250 [Bradymonadia bacterium]